MKELQGCLHEEEGGISLRRRRVSMALAWWSELGDYTDGRTGIPLCSHQCTQIVVQKVMPL